MIHTAPAARDGCVPRGTVVAWRPVVTSVIETLRQLREQVVRVTLDLSPPGSSVAADGRDVVLSNGALSFDPGDHVIVVTAAGHRPWREELHAAPGQQIARAVRLEPDAPARAATPPPVLQPTVATTTPATPHPREETASRPITSRWWFWTAIGLVAAGGITAGVAAAMSGTEDLVAGTRFNVQTVTSR